MVNCGQKGKQKHARGDGGEVCQSLARLPILFHTGTGIKKTVNKFITKFIIFKNKITLSEIVARIFVLYGRD